MKRFLVITICMVLMLQVVTCGFTNAGCLFDMFPFNTNALKNFQEKESFIKSPSLLFEKTPLNSLNANDLDQESLVDVPVERSKESSKYKMIAQTMGYDNLDTSAQRKAYKAMIEASYGIRTKADEQGYYPIKQVVVDNVTMPEEEIKKVIHAFQIDNPLIFWIANLYGFWYDSSNTYIQLYSYINSDKCEEYMTSLCDKIDEIISSMPQGLSEFDRELYLHDHLLEICDYDLTATEKEEGWQAYTAYGALINGKAVCEGYARAMQALLSHVNMKCTLVNGISGQSTHMWNIVMVDGSWYHLDVTWDEPDKMNRYDYFNVTDEVILKDHILDPDYKSLTKDEICGKNGVNTKTFNLNLPECNNSYYNYFEVFAVKVDSLNPSSDTKIINRLYNLAKGKKEYFSLKISDSLDYKSTIEKIFSKQPYKLLYYINEVNKKLDSAHQIDSSKIMYAKVENQNSVTIKLSYL